MGPDLEPKVTLPWLIRLRFWAAAAQIAALSLSRWVLRLELSWLPLIAVVLVTVGTNLGLRAIVRKRQSFPASGILGGVLALDVVLLTVLLSASGGPMNPFTVIYLVHITLSAVVLSAAWTVSIAVLSIAGFGALFLFAADDPHAHHGHGALAHHLEGMWVAFVLAAGLTAFFVRRVALAIARQREQIATLRETSARNAKLAALTTLAAGAAHELGSPLGTIAVAAHEAELVASKLPGGESVSSDLRLIELEVERCREILGQMAARASETREGSKLLTADDLGRRIEAELGAAKARVVLELDRDAPSMRVPVEPLLQSVLALVKNAIDASRPEEPITVRTTRDRDQVRISIADRGTGIPGALLQRIGEPFFTTKQPGRGIGLGVFLARAFAESQGGALTIDSAEGRGTLATLSLPASVTS
jgi:two-component system sensor histidine kinase RegB